MRLAGEMASAPPGCLTNRDDGPRLRFGGRDCFGAAELAEHGHGAGLSVCRLRHQGLRRARDPGGAIPFHAGQRAPQTGRHVALPPEIIDYKGFNALAAELEGFAAAINGERAYPITAGEILHGVAAFEAIVRSAALHQPVQVAQHEI